MSDPELVVDRDADRTLRIGRPPAAPAGHCLVCLAGVDLLVDPTDPEGPPFLTVWEPTVAEPALIELLGERSAQDALGLGPAERTVVVARRGELADGVTRVAVLRWLGAASPDPIAEEVWRVETALAVLAVDEVMAPELVEQARQDLLASGPAVARWSAQARDRGAAGPWADLVREAVPAALAEADLDDPDGAVAADLRHEDELAPVAGEETAFRVPDDLSVLADRALPLAVHAGAPTAGRRTASVDWRQVPRGLLDPGEDTVEWAVVGNSLQVSARAAAAANPGGRLAFRAYERGNPLPVARGLLRLDGGTWVGEATLLADTPRADPAALEIDVADADRARRPRLGRAARRARAERWAARGVTALRLGASGGARGALEESVRLYRALAGEAPQARRGEARATAVLRATLAAEGRARMAEAVGRAWLSPQLPVDDDDVAVPDLDTPGWSRTVTEHLLLSGAGTLP
ncbi:hypothetical protein [Actinomycetospora soli]|uniref:hypothetical protein n=1 Tax=Actinomycetospora soli TaxID=2893887 RepID=UPI001E3AF86A|nr:hypothetical protein [Actinomycetospora soli]MCD2187849.1 hypothetical protein [Actinomycetospora soli]